MNPTLTITKIPTFNSVVIKQHGGYHFISAPNSIVIGKESFMILLEGLLKFEFLDKEDLLRLVVKVDIEKRENYENKKNIDSATIGISGVGEDYGLKYTESKDGEPVS